MSELRFLQKSGASDMELATMCQWAAEKIPYEILIAAYARRKLSETANRREGVYNRAGEGSETFCGKEEQRHE